MEFRSGSIHSSGTVSFAGLVPQKSRSKCEIVLTEILKPVGATVKVFAL